MARAADFLLGTLEKQFDTRAGRVREGRGQLLFRRVVLGALAAALLIGFGSYIFNRFRAGGSFGVSNTRGKERVVVGSKDFTESVLLAEMVAQMLEARGVEVERSFELAGNLTHTSLVSGRIDCYPEYTGTAYTAILQHKPVTDPRAVYDQVKREYEEKFGVTVSAPLGFENTFAILMRGQDARRLNLKTISDVTAHAPKLRAGFGQDFMSRADGYAGFAAAYNLRFAEKPREMDLSLTYIALASNQVDIIAGNSTEGRIATLDLFQLEDDRRYFPPYEAVILARRDTLQRSPALAEVLAGLNGVLSTEDMRRLNYQVDGEKRTPREVVALWLKGKQ